MSSWDGPPVCGGDVLRCPSRTSGPRHVEHRREGRRSSPSRAPGGWSPCQPSSSGAGSPPMDFDNRTRNQHRCQLERLRKRANALALDSVPTSVPTPVFGAPLKVHFTPVFAG